MISKILIANRGEIACRIIRTAKRLAISTVAVYSEADKQALHVSMADEAVCLGAAEASQSYLNTALIIQKAKELNVDAIHPGYGFLSENATFAQLCQQNNIIFIGPSCEAIKAMGSKSAAKTIMEEAKVPLVPGYHGDNQDPSFLHQQAQAMGYPVLLKAAAGGGGKGMRQVWNDQEFMEALEGAKRESMNSFSDDHMLIEKYLTEPRHVEIQVFCDKHGNGVYLFERDCSVQRRHQKIIEEAPAPNFPQEVREKMGEAALKAAFAIDYTGAGTVEFLYDKDGSFYFMEMNTRLQVEHPVTELISGEDLVEWQIRVANNQTLPKKQHELSMNGHAFEARIYAEDPANDFLPSTGLIEHLEEPVVSNCVRIDTGVQAGDEISIYYDPMIAKLIVWSENRSQALSLLKKCLQQYMLCGVTTNIPYLIQVAQSQPFVEAQLSTDFIERHSDAIKLLTPQLSELQQLACIGVLLAPNQKLTTDLSAFRLNHASTSTINFACVDSAYSLEVQQHSPQTWTTHINDSVLSFEIIKDTQRVKVISENQQHTYKFYENSTTVWLQTENGTIKIDKVLPDMGTHSDASDASDILAPMNGNLVSMLVNEGDTVSKGQVLAIVEAMKMEHSLKAPFDGVVEACLAKAGDRVDGNEILIKMNTDSSLDNE